MAPRVLVCSADAILSNLIQRNLAERRFAVDGMAWAPCWADTQEMPSRSNAVIADLNCLQCPEPACWQGVAPLRERVGSVPIIFLGHDWPDARRLRANQPCAWVRQPIAINELLRVLRELLPPQRPSAGEPGNAASES